MELLDIVNKNGIPTGETVDRETAHAQGIPHRTSHVWILRHHHGRLQILLQKRSEEKDSYPGCYDISSAGHIPAGVDFIPSALRELQEELGVDADAGELIYCGQRRFTAKMVFRGKPFYDRQVSNIYILWLDRRAEDFRLQKEEVSAVRWFDFDDCVYKVSHGQIPNCIYLDELQLVEQGAKQSNEG